jgi:hypothetical protein
MLQLKCHGSSSEALRLGNVVKASLKDATVVFVYLLPKAGRNPLLFLFIYAVGAPLL